MTAADLRAAWRSLLPPGVVGGIGPVPPGAAPVRDREFATGRTLVSRVLRDAGVAVPAIPRGASGAPCWPPGWTGSISHAGGWCIAAIAPAAATAGLGIDIELVPEDTAALEEIVLSPSERAWLARRPPAARRLHVATLFSAKESLFKALSPAGAGWIDFHDAQRTGETERHITFTVAGAAVSPLRVAWRHSAGFVLTLVALDAPGTPG